MQAYMAEHEGKLCVVEVQTLGMEPIRRRYYWNTGALARDYPHLVGLPAAETGLSTFVVTTPSGIAVPVQLKDGGATQAIHTEDEPLKPPKGGPWRYSYGEWINTKTGKRRLAA